MSNTLELEKAENWAIRDSQFFIAGTETLPEYVSALDFSSNIISVLVDNSAARETWKFAGWISQIINLPFGPSTSSTISKSPLWLQRKQLLIFPKLTLTYRIAVQFPRWFDRASITVWEYLR